MKENKNRVGWVVSAAFAVVIGVLFTLYELSSYEYSTRVLVHALADGFFAAAVLYLGFGLLMLIADAGNFYGLQYLAYSLAYTFSFRKSDFDKRKKDYYTFRLEKDEKRREGRRGFTRFRGILIGSICLAVSLGFTVLFYYV